ncbi:MAG: sigma-70 family RNA polymerase sigma factor [Propionibacteriaceae bacterium]|nr:sigma-70 family RNA polymerase sigma factor [Propionibacteriaceae bacterium]
MAWEQDETPGSAWLFVTARNLLRNHHRANARLAELHNRLRMERAAEPPAANDALLDAIETLPDSQRELLLAHYWDGLSGAECAALVGCSPGSVWVALHRARANLRRQLTKG